ncbi:protein YpfM [Brenneria goodwinii]|nr:protein YpfM [Brenneria goodwinii]MCG8161526.1 protein YpfM [Brenneria goodwinii]MCG8165585.1 protein YpfM [Brenneria goodwinii]MCG8170073.1 protein YpfM [Brenneria goodwinii]MCG8174283.1 protein YpfM [Brenneria goodwinii]
MRIIRAINYQEVSMIEVEVSNWKDFIEAMLRK